MHLVAASSLLLAALSHAGSQPLHCSSGSSGLTVVATTDVPGAQDRVVFTEGLLTSVNYYLFPAPGNLPNLYVQDDVTGEWQVAGRLQFIQTMTSPPSYYATYTTTSGVVKGYDCGR